MTLSRTTVATLLSLVALLSLPNAHATLIDRGGGLIYDDVLDVTWLQQAVGPFRITRYFNALSWASNLEFGGFDDWRLPSISVSAGVPTGSATRPNVVDCSTASEMECRDNELGYMYYQNLGSMLGDDLRGDQGLFKNIQFGHWSGTNNAPSSLGIWTFFYFNGTQVGTVSGENNFAAWAVRDGDVLAVPEPATALLFAAGLAGIGFAQTRTGRSPKLPTHR